MPDLQRIARHSWPASAAVGHGASCGTVAGFVSEWWPGSNRNGGRYLGAAAGFRLECLAGLAGNLSKVLRRLFHIDANRSIVDKFL
jgi:hypothetical protein